MKNIRKIASSISQSRASDVDDGKKKQLWLLYGEVRHATVHIADDNRHKYYVFKKNNIIYGKVIEKRANNVSRQKRM